MRVPDELSALVDDGIIDEVIRPLMSGKEAQIYLVLSQGEERVAKIYKQAQNRSFKHRADYTEGRKVRNSRDQRAMAKRSKHGREQDEASWRSTEVDTIYRLQSAGVPVPTPYQFVDGVLVMELVKDEFGSPAPRLAEVDFDPREATQIYEIMMRRVVQMLCAGVVHGDLSEFNVLLGGHGPVVIDFPQAVDPSKNQNARMLLVRDVENLHRFHQRFVPNAPKLPYAQEMWALFEQNRLTPDTRLSGRFVTANTRVDTSGVMALIGEANRDEMRRRTAHGAGNHRASQNPNHAPHAQARRNDAPQNQGRSSSPTSGAPQAGRRPPLPASGAPQAGRRPQSPPPAARASAGRSPAQTSPAQTSPAQTSGAAPKARRVEIIVEKVARPGGWRGRPNLSVNHPTSFAGDRPSHGPAQARPPQHSDRPAQPARAPVDRAPRGPSQGVRSSQPQPQPNGSRRSHSARRPG